MPNKIINIVNTFISCEKIIRNDQECGCVNQHRTKNFLRRRADDNQKNDHHLAEHRKILEVIL